MPIPFLPASLLPASGDCSVAISPEDNRDGTWSVVATLWHGDEIAGRHLLWKCERQEDAALLVGTYWKDLVGEVEEVPGL